LSIFRHETKTSLSVISERNAMIYVHQMLSFLTKVYLGLRFLYAALSSLILYCCGMFSN